MEMVKNVFYVFIFITILTFKNISLFQFQYQPGGTQSEAMAIPIVIQITVEEEGICYGIKHQNFMFHVSSLDYFDNLLSISRIFVKRLLSKFSSH